MKSRMAFWAGVFGFLLVFRTSAFADTGALEILGNPNRVIAGMNLNADVQNLNAKEPARYGIVWQRAFINVFKYQEVEEALAEGRPLGPFQKLTKKRLDALDVLQTNSQFRTFISLKWDFAGYGRRVPQPNSVEENRLFELALRMIRRFGVKATVIALGNEPMLETLPEDLINLTEAQFGIAEPNPAARFYRRLAGVVNTELIRLNIRQNKIMLLGALNLLQYDGKVQSDFVKRTMWIANDADYIDGVDLHIHMDSMESFERYLRNVREVYPHYNKMLTVSEYSLVWAFRRNFLSPACQGAVAGAYCQDVGIPQNAREIDVLNLALQKPPVAKFGPSEWARFYRTRSYLPSHFLLNADSLFAQYGVSLSTYAGYSDATQLNYVVEDVPWVYNGLFCKGTIRARPDGTTAANPYFMDDFVQLYRGQAD